MNFIQWLKTFIRYLPQIVVVVREVVGWISKAVDAAEKAERLRALREGLKNAKDTKDTSAVDAAFNSRMRDTAK